MNKFYIYIHLKLGTNEVFYVGKGKDNRAYSKKGRNDYWKNIVNKYGFEVQLIEENLTEEKAFELEIYWIAQFRAWNFKLCNMTEGGEGTSGFIPWNKGKKCPQLSGINNFFYGKSINRVGTEAPFYGYKHKEDSKNRTSNTLKERYANQKHHLKGKSPINKGKKFPELSGINSSRSKKVNVDGIVYNSISEYCNTVNIVASTFYRNKKKRNIKYL